MIGAKTRALGQTLLFAAVLVLAACMNAPTGPASEAVVVAPVTGAEQGDAHRSRQALQEDVMRFADRFSGQLTQIAESVRYDGQSGVGRIDGIVFQYAVQAAPLDIAMGPNPVTNLMDMMVLATLARHASEAFWAGMIQDPVKRQIMLDTVARLEADIWRVSDKVLSPPQQSDLRGLVEQWRSENPGVRNIWRIRFSAFSGQRAAALQEVQRSGGLLGDITRSLDAVEEMQETVERLLYYSQRAPELVRLQTEWAIYEVLGQREIQTLVQDADRLTLVAEQLSALAESLPDREIAAVDQLLSGLSAERERLFGDLVAEEPRVRALLAELRELMNLAVAVSANVKDTTSHLERTALAVNLDLSPPDTGTEPLDLAEYTALVRESSGAVLNVRQLVDAIDAEAVDSQVDELIDKAFLYIVLLIITFFTCLLLYGFVKKRFLESDAA